jgi:hypothetical protein
MLFGVLAGVGLVRSSGTARRWAGSGSWRCGCRTNGFPAGRTQLIFDAFVFALALFLFDWANVVGWSLLGA